MLDIGDDAGGGQGDEWTASPLSLPEWPPARVSIHLWSSKSWL